MPITTKNRDRIRKFIEIRKKQKDLMIKLLISPLDHNISLAKQVLTGEQSIENLQRDSRFLRERIKETLAEKFLQKEVK